MTWHPWQWTLTLHMAVTWDIRLTKSTWQHRLAWTGNLCVAWQPWQWTMLLHMDGMMHLAHDMAKQTDLDWDLVQCMASLAMDIGLAHGWHMGH